MAELVFHVTAHHWDPAACSSPRRPCCSGEDLLASGEHSLSAAASLVFIVPRMDREAVPSVCAVCFRDGHNRRVLKCLHSFCASCIDQLVLSEAAAESHEHEVACPLCRTRTRLPKNGAAGLPKDMKKGVVDDLQCETCKGKGESQQPGVWCVKCECALCFKHMAEHMSSGLGPTSHNIVRDLPKPSMAPDDSTSLCEEHDEPLKYFCTMCDVPVCGDCIAIGRHRGHQPLATMKEVTVKLKKKVQTKADHLERDVLPRAEKTISRVDHVSAKLTARADNVRADIQAAADSAVSTIRACEQQQLQEVDDIEQIRHKALDRQKDDLQRHAEAMKTAIAFSKKLERLGVCSESEGNLLVALDKRTTSLASVDFSESPLHQSDISFETVGEADLIAKAGELVGLVSSCEASAATSIVEGGFKKSVQKGYPATFTVVAMDRRGKTMTGGGDAICASWSGKPAEAANLPAVEVKDNGNGRYDIMRLPSCVGKYAVEVSVSGTKLSRALIIACTDRWFKFDSAQCQDKNSLNSDKMTVTHTGRDSVWSSVLGSQGVQQGQHSWRVQVDRSYHKYVFVGVAEKGKLTDKNNFKQSYSWSGQSGWKWVMGSRTPGISEFRFGDILRLDLNCDEHTLRITNQRSGETDTIDNLPASELFPYFATYNTKDSFSLVW